MVSGGCRFLASAPLTAPTVPQSLPVSSSSVFVFSPLHPHRVVVQAFLAEGGLEEEVLEEEEEGEEEAD